MTSTYIEEINIARIARQAGDCKRYLSPRAVHDEMPDISDFHTVPGFHLPYHNYSAVLASSLLQPRSELSCEARDHVHFLGLYRNWQN